MQATYYSVTVNSKDSINVINLSNEKDYLTAIRVLNNIDGAYVNSKVHCTKDEVLVHNYYKIGSYRISVIKIYYIIQGVQNDWLNRSIR